MTEIFSKFNLQNCINDWMSLVTLTKTEQDKFHELMNSNKNKNLSQWIVEAVQNHAKFHTDVVMERHNKILNQYYINDMSVAKPVYDFAKFLSTQVDKHDYSREM